MPMKRKNNENSNYLNPQACIFCFSDEDNEVLMGKFIKSEVICMHANCLFFASGLNQCGDESDEFLGFLIPDIEAEVRRGRKLFCSYCKKRGATVGCSITACKKSFHLNCGIQHGSLHQFYGAFCSYCKHHKPVQRPIVPDNFNCHICKEDIMPDEVESCLYSPCCKKNLFHKLCLQTYALNAGYFFKCPLCNDNQQFMDEMRHYGINIPQQDASWELEANAYEELLTRPECEAPNCLCPRGRSYCAQRRCGWTLVTCTYCGFHARHKNCDDINSDYRWLCEECNALEEEIVKSKAMSEIGGKSGPCASNFSMSPKVVLEDCLSAKSSLHRGTRYDTLLNSANMSHKRGKYQSVPETVATNDDMDICETPILPGPSFCDFTNRARKASLIPVSSRAANLRDIKNVPYNSQVQRVKNSPKARASGKPNKKQKGDNQFFKGNQSLITSYFGHSNEKKIRL